MRLESHGEPVRGRAGQARHLDQLGERRGRVGDGVQDAHCLVKNADAAMLSHVAILWSHNPGWQETMGKTLAEKLWDNHVVHSAPGEPDVLYIDLHLVHEVTSPQAFEGLRLAGRPVRRPDLTLATEDHNTPTDGTPTAQLIKDELSRKQVETLE